MTVSKTLEGIAVSNVAVEYPSDRQITEAIKLIMQANSPQMSYTIGERLVIIEAPLGVTLLEAERRIRAVAGALYTISEMVSEIVFDQDMRPALHVTNFNWVD